MVWRNLQGPSHDGWLQYLRVLMSMNFPCTTRSSRYTGYVVRTNRDVKKNWQKNQMFKMLCFFFLDLQVAVLATSTQY
jgi:hypothetical protein